jgi:hypothetical protein
VEDRCFPLKIEYDFLHINVLIVGLTLFNDALVDFLHDLKSEYDRRYVGILSPVVTAAGLDVY